MSTHISKTKLKLGKRIQKLRKALDYSQEKFSEIIGISRTHIGHIEQGRKSPSLKVLERIAKVLKVKTGDLFP